VFVDGADHRQDVGDVANGGQTQYADRTRVHF
jgi:hypothetical protein